MSVAASPVTKWFFFNISETVRATNFNIDHDVVLDSLYILTGNDLVSASGQQQIAQTCQFVVMFGLRFSDNGSILKGIYIFTGSDVISYCRYAANPFHATDTVIDFTITDWSLWKNLETNIVHNFKIHCNVAIKPLHFDRKWSHYLFPVGSKSHKRFNCGSGSRRNFWITIQSISNRFTVFESVVKMLHLLLVKIVGHFCSLTPKMAPKWTSRRLCITQMADFDFTENC